MIGAPFIAGVGKDTGSPVDFSLAAFLGADELDFKSVVAGFFAAASVNKPTEAPVTGKAEAERKGSAAGVKISDKPEKPTAASQADANVPAGVPLLLASVPASLVQLGQVPAQPAVDASPASSEGQIRPFDKIGDTAELAPSPVNKPTSTAQMRETVHTTIPADMQPVARPARADAPEEDEVVPVSADQRVDPQVESSPKVNSGARQLDASNGAISPKQADAIAHLAEKEIVPEVANAVESGAVPSGDDRAGVRVRGRDVFLQGDRVKKASIATDALQDTSEAAGTETPTLAQRPPIRDSQVSSHPAVSGMNPATHVLTDEVRVLLANQPDEAPVPAGASVKTTVPQAVEGAVAQTVSKPVRFEATSVAAAFPNEVAPADVPATPVEPRKGQMPELHVEGGSKVKARRESKETAGATPVPANPLARHVEGAATVLSSGVPKESAGQGSHDKPSLPSTHLANDTAMPALDDGADEALPSPHTLVNTAKLVQSLSESELRVGMQSREYGSVDIRTSVARHVFSAQISVEHGDVARNLTNDLPALMDRLADQQVLVGNIEVHSSGLATSSGLAQDAQAQSWKPQASMRPQSDVELVHPAMLEGASSSGRLDIRV